MDLNICSLDVRGLGERLKRRETFNWLRAKKFSIYLLQETHCSENTTTTWSSLAAFLAPVVELQFSSTRISLFSWKDRIRIPRADLLLVIFAPNDHDPAFF